jgi:hypothetical protein
MNYCTIQEAWGQGNYISNHYKDENVGKKSIENFKSCKNPTIKRKKETFTNLNKVDKSNCNNFFNHLKNCRQCQIKMRDQFRPKILENFEDIIQTNRDIIVLILVGLCFMIFFNMISNITSNNKN